MLGPLGIGPGSFPVDFTILYDRSLCKVKVVSYTFASEGSFWRKIFMWLLSSPFLKWYEKGDEYN